MLLHALKYLLLPPLINALLMLAGLLLWKSHRLLGPSLLVLGLASLLVFSLPWVSYWLRKGLEPYEPPSQALQEQAEAIVILGGGRDYGTPEFGWGDAPNNVTWRRLGYGAWLSRETGLPILVSGGRVNDETLAEATLMARTLGQAFGLEARWIEGRSRTTAENAEFSAAILEQEGIARILLVSQAWHLPRAVPEFERAGLEVTPAPTEFASRPPPKLIAWIPRAYHLRQSTQALHEWLGRIVYRVNAD
ncbi:YdcF family protein [Halomonas sp. PR-M31]|uniref:YdcF family protein n=1 Tax=Halomonas sp. PR-M31 TaxID=1471202 RepID=UPI000652158E|nr:YdcF family protein [Halomonas sp. PR-M31]